MVKFSQIVNRKGTMENFFKLKENNTSIKTEILAGLVTFCAMVYILMVNANMYTNPLGSGENILGLSYGAVYISTALSAVIACFLMGLIAKLPIGLASGMGLNAFFIYTVCVTLGFSYENALVTILIESVLFLILTLAGALSKIYDAIPNSIRAAIPAGIGLFMALLGFQNSGIIIPNSATGIALNSFNLLHVSFTDIMPAIVGLITLFTMVIMTKKNIKGSILWGIVIGVASYYLIGLFVPNFYNNINIETLNPVVAFKEFFTESFCKVFVSGFDFSDYITKHGVASWIITLTTTSISFCLVNIFDNIGSLYAACEHGKLLKNNQIPNINKAMLANSLSATTGSVLGISTVTTYVESTTGIMEGGRTGLTAISTGMFFLIAMFFSPLAQLVPSCTTAAALIYVGILMMSSVKNIDWSSMESSVPAFLTICIMPYSCNISNGIAFGILSYVIINTFTGKFKDIQFTTWIIAFLFALMLLLSH